MPLSNIKVETPQKLPLFKPINYDAKSILVHKPATKSILVHKPATKSILVHKPATVDN